MIFQEPLTALNPVIAGRRPDRRGPARHLGLVPRAARAAARSSMMRRDGHPRPGAPGPCLPARAVRRYAPADHDRDRAVSCSPQLLLCDEPTTALDVTVPAPGAQAARGRSAPTLGTALVFVTHDLAVVAQTCTEHVGDVLRPDRRDRTGRRGSSRDPRHPYTRRAARLRAGLRPAATGTLLPIPGSPPNLFGRPPGAPSRPDAHSSSTTAAGRAPARATSTRRPRGRLPRVDPDLRGSDR